MILCPTCGSEARVSETRDAGESGYVRRRRICANESCRQRVTTYEFIVRPEQGSLLVNVPGDLMLVNRSDLDAAWEALARMIGSSRSPAPPEPPVTEGATDG